MRQTCRFCLGGGDGSGGDEAKDDRANAPNPITAGMAVQVSQRLQGDSPKAIRIKGTTNRGDRNSACFQCIVGVKPRCQGSSAFIFKTFYCYKLLIMFARSTKFAVAAVSWVRFRLTPPARPLAWARTRIGPCFALNGRLFITRAPFAQRTHPDSGPGPDRARVPWHFDGARRGSGCEKEPCPG
jgi:hypothetical protein